MLVGRKAVVFVTRDTEGIELGREIAVTFVNREETLFVLDAVGFVILDGEADGVAPVVDAIGQTACRLKFAGVGVAAGARCGQRRRTTPSLRDFVASKTLVVFATGEIFFDVIPDIIDPVVESFGPDEGSLRECGAGENGRQSGRCGKPVNRLHLSFLSWQRPGPVLDLWACHALHLGKTVR